MIMPNYFRIPIRNVMKHKIANQTGVALIQVLLLVVLLMLMSLHFSLSSKQYVNQAISLQDKVTAEVQLKTLESEVLFALMTQSRNDISFEQAEKNAVSTAWNFYGEVFEPFSNTNVSIQDMNGLLSLYGNLNNETLEQLLIQLGQTSAQARKIVANINRWQGLEERGLTGNSDRQMRKDFLMNVTELKHLESIDDALYKKLAPLVTNYSALVFNPMAAPIELLRGQLNNDVIEEINTLRKSNLLTRTRFIEMTQIQEEDTITFSPGRKLKLSLKVEYGSAIAKKTEVFDIRPESPLPLIWYQ
jgi:general secretion pathway protein K